MDPKVWGALVGAVIAASVAVFALHRKLNQASKDRRAGVAHGHYEKIYKPLFQKLTTLEEALDQEATARRASEALSEWRRSQEDNLRALDGTVRSELDELCSFLERCSSATKIEATATGQGGLKGQHFQLHEEEIERMFREPGQPGRGLGQYGIEIKDIDSAPIDSHSFRSMCRIMIHSIRQRSNQVLHPDEAS